MFLHLLVEDEGAGRLVRVNGRRVSLVVYPRARAVTVVAVVPRRPPVLRQRVVVSLVRDVMAVEHRPLHSCNRKQHVHFNLLEFTSSEIN